MNATDMILSMTLLLNDSYVRETLANTSMNEEVSAEEADFYTLSIINTIRTINIVSANILMGTGTMTFRIP